MLPTACLYVRRPGIAMPLTKAPACILSAEPRTAEKTLERPEIKGCKLTDLAQRLKMTATHKGRVLFVVTSLMVGGTESQLVHLATGLASRGWSVRVFALDRSGPLVEPLEAAEITIVDGGFVRSSSSRFGKAFCLLRAQLRLVRETLAWRPDILHGFLPLPNFLTGIAGRLTRVRLIVTSRRGLGTHQDRHPSLRWMDRVANRLSHVVTANSVAIARDVERRDGYAEARVRVIPNGVDFTRFGAGGSSRTATRRSLQLEDGDPAIVLVANLLPYKGHSELIDAFAVVVSQVPRARLFLVGEDRGIKASLTEQARELGIADRIEMLGRRSDVAELLLAMDIGVMASHEEGLSNALLEKLAAGLPVVATDVGGTGEALADMPDCRLVRARCSADLADGIIHAWAGLADSELRRALRQRLVRDRYSMETMVDNYDTIYQKAGLNTQRFYHSEG